MSNEVIATIVGGAICTVLGCVITWWLSKKRPHYIIVEEVAYSPVIGVPKSLREKVAASYDGLETERVFLLQLIVKNMGNDCVSDATLHIQCKEGAAILDALSKDDRVQFTIMKDNSVQANVSMLNSAIEHNDSLPLNLVCSGFSRDFSVQGAGKNWSVQFKTINGRYQSIVSRLKYLGAFLFFVFLFQSSLSLLFDGHFVLIISILMAVIGFVLGTLFVRNLSDFLGLADTQIDKLLVMHQSNHDL